jgi:hypothetical protein
MREIVESLKRALEKKDFYRTVEKTGELFVRGMSYSLVEEFDPAANSAEKALSGRFPKTSVKSFKGTLREAYQEPIGSSLNVSHYANPSTEKTEGSVCSIYYYGRYPDALRLSKTEFFPYGVLWTEALPSKEQFPSSQIQHVEILKLPKTQFIQLNSEEFLEAIEKVFEKSKNK